MVGVRWKTARVLSDFLLRNPSLVRDKRILELGAGAGLPSIVSSLAGAKEVVITDYPDEQLVDNIRYNVECNISADIRKTVHVGVSFSFKHGMSELMVGRDTFGNGTLRASSRWVNLDQPQIQMDDTISSCSVTLYSTIPRSANTNLQATHQS